MTHSFSTVAAKPSAQASSKPALPKSSDPAKNSDAAVNGQKLARADGKSGSLQKAQPPKPSQPTKLRPPENKATANGISKGTMDSSSDSVRLFF